MKKKQIKMLAAMGCLAILIVGYAGLKCWNNVESKEETETAQTVLAELPEDEMVQISFQGKDKDTYTFEKKEDIWYYTADYNFPVDAGIMTTKLSALSSVSTKRIIENPENLDNYGLKNPSKIISVTKEDESITTIYLGNKSTTGEYYGYMNDNTEKIYLVDSYLYTNLDVTLYDLAEMESVSSITSSVVSSLTIHNDVSTFSVYESGESYTGWYVNDWNDVLKEAGSSQVSTQFATIINNAFSTYVNYNPDDLSLYGLDEPKAEIIIDYRETVAEESDEKDDETENEKEIATIAKQFIIYVGNTDTDGNYYVMTSETDGVYTMSAENINYYLESDINDYLDLHPHDYSSADLEQLDITYNGKVYSIKSITTEIEEESTDKNSEIEKSTTRTETNYYVNGNMVDGTKFLAFYNDVSSMAGQERGDSVEPVNEEPEITLTFYISAGGVFEAKYYAHDTNFYLVKDNKENGYLVNKMYVKNMIEDLKILLS